MTRRPAGADFRDKVAARFDAAARSYDAHSPVQRHAAQRLAGLIATASLPPRPRVLEIGCGTGHLTHALTIHLPGAHLLATDIAPAMAAACRSRLPRLAYAVMDGLRPGVAGPFDLVCANLVVQWFVDLPAALARLAALLAPGGCWRSVCWARAACRNGAGRTNDSAFPPERSRFYRTRLAVRPFPLETSRSSGNIMSTVRTAHSASCVACAPLVPTRPRRDTGRCRCGNCVR